MKARPGLCRGRRVTGVPTARRVRPIFYLILLGEVTNQANNILVALCLCNS